MQSKSIEGTEILVPASIANLGPGFDTLAVAVQLYLRVRVVEARNDAKQELEFRFVDQTLKGENYIERAFRFLARKYGKTDFPSLKCEVRTEIPMQAGLGSSAAATVAGLRLFEAVSEPISLHDEFNASCELEGHPDNVAAAVYGGLTGSCQLADGSVIAVPFRWPEQIVFLVLTPEIGLETAKARKALPQLLSREDAVFNLQRVVLLLQALQSGEHHLLKEALKDKWHQPFREMLVPGLEQALALDHPDLLGVCLSGAGPSIAAMAERKNVPVVEELLSSSYASTGIPFRIRTLQVHQSGDAALGATEGSHGFRSTSNVHGSGQAGELLARGTKGVSHTVRG
jgi:homoserine kinase